MTMTKLDNLPHFLREIAIEELLNVSCMSKSGNILSTSLGSFIIRMTSSNKISIFTKRFSYLSGSYKLNETEEKIVPDVCSQHARKHLLKHGESKILTNLIVKKIRFYDGDLSPLIKFSYDIKDHHNLEFIYNFKNNDLNIKIDIPIEYEKFQNDLSTEFYDAEIKKKIASKRLYKKSTNENGGLSELKHFGHPTDGD